MRIKKQDDIKDCGLSVLQAFHAHFYNRWININEFKRKAHYGLKGVNIEGICTIAKHFGMKITPLKGDFSSFSQLKLEKPIIVLIGNEQENHYVIVNRIKSKTVHYSDSISGQEEVSTIEEFSKRYMGVIMEVEKTQYTHKKVKINSLYEYVFQFKRIIPFIIVSIVITSVIGFSSSWFMKLIMDQIIPGSLHETLKVLFIAFLTLSILGVCNITLRNYVIYKISLQISCEVTEKFNKKLLEANYMEISKLSKEDIIKRASYIDSISLFISSALFSIIGEIITCIVAGSVLIWLDQRLFLVALIGTLLLMGCSFAVHKILNKQYTKYIKTQIKTMGSNLDLLSSLKNTRENDSKDLLLIKQSKNLYNYKKQSKKIWNINNCNDVIKGVINVVIPLVIILISTRFVMKHQISIGSMILFVSMFAYFMNPAMMLIDVFLKYPLIKREMNMLLYVLELPNERTNPKGGNLDKVNSISVKKLSFGFEEGKEILKIKNMHLKNNSKIVGKNGSGKSTLFNIISTLIHVGGVYFNEIETKYYNLENVRGNIFHSSADIHMPKTSVFEYATKNNIKRQEVFTENIKKYRLDKLFSKLGVRLEGVLLNNGGNLSSGQRQFVMLLPLFTKNFKVILLDEAFENMAPEITEEVMNKIKEVQKEAFFLEISHSKRYINKGREVLIEKLK